MKIRNKITKQVFEVLPGTLYAKNIFEEVTDEEIRNFVLENRPTLSKQKFQIFFSLF